MELVGLRAGCSDDDPFDFVQVDLVGAPVVEAGGPGRLVVGHLLSDLQLAAVAKVLGDAGSAEAAAADACANPYRACSASERSKGAHFS